MRGTETFTQSIPGYDGVKNLANAASVVFAPVADQNIAVCPAAFTDPTLIAGVTAIKAVHIDETRLCVNALRTLAGLPHVSWTPAGNAITASTMTEMRNALDPARSLLSLPAIPYARPTITSGMTILANDLQEIRNGTR